MEPVGGGGAEVGSAVGSAEGVGDDVSVELPLVEPLGTDPGPCGLVPVEDPVLPGAVVAPSALGCVEVRDVDAEVMTAPGVPASC